MKLNELGPAEGSSKAAWRKGRGAGSGNGKTAGKSHKVGTPAPAAVSVPALREVSSPVQKAPEAGLPQ